MQLLSNRSSLSHPQHTCTHTPPSSSSKDCSAFNKRKKIITIIKIAIIKKIYSIHFLLVYYIGIFCT